MTNVTYTILRTRSNGASTIIIISLTQSTRPSALKGSHVLKSQLLHIFLSEKDFKKLGIPGKLYVGYFQFNINLQKMPFSK